MGRLILYNLIYSHNHLAMDLKVIDREANENSNHFGWPENGGNMVRNVAVFKSFFSFY